MGTNDIAAIAWRAPPGWVAPPWLEPEPPVSVPMRATRMRWCLQAIGWSLEELSRRVYTNEASIRQMARDRRSIPDELATWLEAKAAHMLASPQLPENWRAAPPSPAPTV